jgi:putative phosphotransacetylase
MDRQILVETSARHVHVTQETLEALFGKGHVLTVKKELSQPGQFASNDKVLVIGNPNPKDPSKPAPSYSLSILGPVRDHNQVELSFTDARGLNISAPVRESGDIKGTPSCTLRGPVGEVVIKEGVIIAKRHIHMTPADASEFGVKNGDIVSVLVDTNRGGRRCSPTRSSASPRSSPWPCTSTPTSATPPAPPESSTEPLSSSLLS